MKVLIAEDSALFREGLRLLLESAGYDVVAQVATADDLLPSVRAIESLDLIITDVRMPPHDGNDGLFAAIKVRQEYRYLPILVLSQYVADVYALQLLNEPSEKPAPAGLGYLLKESVGEVEDFLKSVAVVAAGGIVFDPTIVRLLLQSGQKGGIGELSPREQEALSHMAAGMSNTEIAEKMHLSLAGTSKHIGKVFEKMGLIQEDGNQRVLAVLKYLDQMRAGSLPER